MKNGKLIFGFLVLAVGATIYYYNKDSQPSTPQFPQLPQGGTPNTTNSSQPDLSLLPPGIIPPGLNLPYNPALPPSKMNIPPAVRATMISALAAANKSLLEASQGRATMAARFAFLQDKIKSDMQTGKAPDVTLLTELSVLGDMLK